MPISLSILVRGKSFLHRKVGWHVQRRYSSHSASRAPTDEKNQIMIPEWDYPIYISDRVKDRKSVFVAHASVLPAPLALSTFLDHLTALSSLKRATHCMYAYRVTADSSQYSQKLLGQHDGGEKGSGERLSRLLEASECENVVVVVSRWYGGVKLGSDRWKLISGVAKEALARGGFGKDKVESSVITPKANAKKKKR